MAEVEGTLEGSNCGLDGGSQVMAFLAILRYASAASSNLSVMMVEIQRPLGLAIEFARPAFILKGTGGTSVDIEVGQICFLSLARFNHYCLPIGAGDPDRPGFVGGGDVVHI